MGILTQQFAANGAAANQSALQWGAVGTGLQAGGQFAAGVGSASNYLFNASLANQNARIAEANASAARQAGDYSAESSKMHYGQLEAAQKVGAAASGVDASTGSAAAVQQSTRTISAMDAAMIHYNASREAYGQEVEAANQKAQAGADQLGAAGALVGGTLGSASTFLGGASSLSQKWSQFRTLSQAGSQ